MSNVGDRIREIRQAAGLSTTDLANKIGVAQSHVSRIERGKVGLTMDAAETIAKALGVSVEDFVAGVDGSSSHNGEATIAVGRRIKEIRKAAGLSAKNLADILGTTQATISRLENGDQGISVEWLALIAGALKVDITELFSSGTPSLGLLHSHPDCECCRVMKKWMVSVLGSPR